MWQLITQPELLIIWLVAIIYAITVHEFSHAYAAYLQGDRTAADQGRLTFNPLAHLDPVGFIVLLLAGFGWGKPVPFNPYNLKNKKWGPVLVSLAGPASNILSFVIFGFVLKILTVNNVLGPENLLINFLGVLIYINFVLAVFNLLPLPPLDGSKLLYAVIPPARQDLIVRLEVYGPWILLAFVIFGGSLFYSLFRTLYSFALRIFG
jgi:Zn-dependent protease